MKRLLVALVATAALLGGLVGSAAAAGPDQQACDAHLEALGALQAAFGTVGNPCVTHP